MLSCTCRPAYLSVCLSACLWYLWHKLTLSITHRGIGYESHRAILNPDGPLIRQTRTQIFRFLSPFSDGGYNASLSVHFPVFDSFTTDDLQMSVEFVPRNISLCTGGLPTEVLTPIEVGKAPAGECENLRTADNSDFGYVTVIEEDGTYFCRAPDTVSPGPAPGETLGEYLVGASTDAMIDRARPEEPPMRSVAGERDVSQLCRDADVYRELSMCAQEQFKQMPNEDASLYTRQTCFWTDTSRANTLGDAHANHRFTQCASCSDKSCTTTFPPLRSWQIKTGA